MANYANQKKIVITNDNINKVAHQPNTPMPFLRAIDWKYIEIAQQVLSGNEFSLLVYILKWAGQGYCDISPIDIYRHIHLTENTVRKCFRTLLDLGYIKQAGSNTYTIDLYPDGIQDVADKLLAQRILS